MDETIYNHRLLEKKAIAPFSTFFKALCEVTNSIVQVINNSSNLLKDCLTKVFSFFLRPVSELKLKLMRPTAKEDPPKVKSQEKRFKVPINYAITKRGPRLRVQVRSFRMNQERPETGFQKDYKDFGDEDRENMRSSKLDNTISNGSSLEVVTETGDKFTSSNGILPIGGEEGDNSPLETQDYESEQYTQLGEDGDSETANEIEIADGDSLVKVDQIIDNFKKLAGGRLRGHTPRQYELIFRRFARTVNLEDYSRRRLQGHIGKELLLQYLLNRSDVPAPSVRTHNVALKCVWIEGLSIPYPIDARRHLGELPEAQRRQSPRDIDVIPWIKALEHEEELYLKGLVLIIFQLGVRPSHACLFRWKHIHYGMDGKPEAVITTGREPGNKKMTPVKARLPEDISNVLAELKKTMPDALSEDPILPHRKPNGQLERNVAMRSVHYSIQWRRFERKHMLNHLRPVDLRHWVSTTCRKANLSLPARNALQGHKFRNENQGEGYDNPQDVDLLAEQERILPYGPIGVICPNMEITQALPVELTDALGGCMKGEILPSQLAEKVTAYLLRQIKKPENTMVA